MEKEHLNFSPASKHIDFDSSKRMICKYSPDGVVEYVNEELSAFTGYEPHEIIGKGINDFVHPDIPKSIQNLLEERLQADMDTHILMKESTKNGQDFWCIFHFEIKKNANNEVKSIISSRESVTSEAIEKMSYFYNKLRNIEKHVDTDTAKKFFQGFLEEKGMSFADYTKSLLVNKDTQERSRKKSFFWRK